MLKTYWRLALSPSRGLVIGRAAWIPVPIDFSSSSSSLSFHFLYNKTQVWSKVQTVVRLSPPQSPTTGTDYKQTEIKKKRRRTLVTIDSVVRVSAKQKKKRSKRSFSEKRQKNTNSLVYIISYLYTHTHTLSRYFGVPPRLLSFLVFSFP